MEQLSRRHHYIPRFLIKNFADDSGMLWVYNKQERKIISKQQSPKAIFFEWERNLFDVNGEPGDNVERLYGEMDDLLAKTLDKILMTRSMTSSELTLMIYLVSLMKWRIPKADMDVRELVKNLSIENLGMAIRTTDPTQEANAEELKKLLQADIISETKRLLLAAQPLLNESAFDDMHQNCFITSNSEFPALLGDCPIIEKSNGDTNTLGDFIFPLSTTVTLICNHGGKRNVHPRKFHAFKDLNTIHRSEKYVACSSRDHLERMVTLYNEECGETVHTDFLERAVFEFIGIKP